MIKEILEKVGLKYDDLGKEELETFHSWEEALARSQVTVESIRKYIKSMRDSVEQELTVSNIKTKQDIFLNARLRNYMLIEAYLSTPEKAKEALDRAVAGLVSKRK